ncbi:UDP-N-acetylmuramate dehydrogenase [Blochmannia endosymbiont of Colobopsis nipponica]|uniref:UDP-N-acetylmuramate dehydrogenase n=1 Tax=Blochmannia endosymbiont of Colobopsis nipponica TaxID=2681987 RepID=UPI00177B6F9A|nr:UDP-N-acetylmuramate dehydrogenase [Blochmannia endosymbiont of Colobopsis nipponica]QOI11228.1 UDP-N-acetylmuramate dehydrogenase [Blochmannia endosymbiont of Colobopsis nipponica]
MCIFNKVTLKYFNTFSIDVSAESIKEVYSESELLIYWRQATQNNKSVLLLGGGCNVLFLEDYNGVVLLNRIKGLLVHESSNFWHLHIGAGEIWHQLVVYSLFRNMPGLENLAWIPGYVGAAPIHNIGAFGVELQQFCEYVDVLQLNNGEKIRFMSFDCKFGYRDSIFKKKFYKYAVVAVGLKISKIWHPVLNYRSLRSLNVSEISPIQLFRFIYDLRCRSIPDPSVIGNAGSFFKNPIVDRNIADNLSNCYPDMPCSFQCNGKVKLFAAWLIDSCHLKGYRLGNAGVYSKQSLVLINSNQCATGIEIVKLACFIRNRVADKFSIWLEPEVRFIDAHGEIDAIKLFNELC